MKKMCRLKDTTGDDQFPKWYKELFAKPQDKKEKAEVVATVIEKYYIFNDTEVLIYPTLLKTTVKRYWMASDIGNRVALVHAARGL